MPNDTIIFASIFGGCALGALLATVLKGKAMRVAWAGFGCLASIAMLALGVGGVFAESARHIPLWTVPHVGPVSFSVDHLSGFFLIVTALVAIPAMIFAAATTSDEKARKTPLAPLSLVLLASVALVILAADVFLFIVAWEVMSILIYLLACGGPKERPGYLMLAVGETGTLAVLVALLLLGSHAGSLSFQAIQASSAGLSATLVEVVFALTFLGFGVKAGLIPLNFWLPEAYTAIPSPIMPFVAGATLNLGLYGIMRSNMYFLPTTFAGPGVCMLLVGAVTALIGILYATIADDFKTLLAHSSIENAGIITTAFGAGMIFLSAGHKAAAAMALIAALYHLLNHSIFKTLLFMGAGTLERSANTRSLDEMGGLLKRMPWTGLFVLVGALSISAMPPFNGFVSEWLTIESLLRSVELSSMGLKMVFVAAGAAIMLTAGLAVTCFVRAFAMSFLGISRSEKAANASETNRAALSTMAAVAVICFVLGVVPTFAIPALDRVVAPVAGASGSTALVPTFFHPDTDKLPKKFTAEFHDLGAQIGKDAIPARGMVVMHRGGKKNPVVFAMSTPYMFVMLVVLLAALVLIVRLATKNRKVSRRPRWDGGVRRFLPEMTYTATGFAQPVRVLFEAIFRPKVSDRRESIAQHFRMSIQRKREEIHLIDRLILYPLAKATKAVAAVFAKMHNGRINAYAVYALLALIIFLAIAAAL